MGKSYDLMKYVELKAEARRRHLPLRGSKDELVRRLVAHDEGDVYRSKPEAPRPEDTIVTTASGNAFKICGRCEKWDRRCNCEDGEDTQKPGPGGTRDPATKDEKTTGPGTNKRARRYVHRGTFA